MTRSCVDSDDFVNAMGGLQSRPVAHYVELRIMKK